MSLSMMIYGYTVKITERIITKGHVKNVVLYSIWPTTHTERFGMSGKPLDIKGDKNEERIK